MQLNVNAGRYWFAFTDIESVIGENAVLDDNLPPPPLPHIVSLNIPEENLFICFRFCLDVSDTHIWVYLIKFLLIKQNHCKKYFENFEAQNPVYSASRWDFQVISINNWSKRHC